jgi:sphinganine-1-phosphate aldolase
MGTALPKQGIPWGALEKRLEGARADDVDWRRGRLSGLVYFGGDDVLQVAKDAYMMFFSENALGQKAFPSLHRMENEIVGMTAAMLGAPEGVGTVTSGGTESIFLALKAARDRTREWRPEVAVPEIVAPQTAHPSFNKHAHYLGMRVTRVPLRGDFRADVSAMAAAIGDNTIMLVGSAPCYPFGVVDPISELGELAGARGLWLHVDACIGGFIAPFAKKLGYPVPPFDFGVAGVTSMSADVHKYGFAAKGASTVLYRHPEDFRHQGYQFNDWPRGLYSTATFTGTRPGGAIAAAWAVMNFLGQEGYTRIAHEVMRIRDTYAAGIADIPGLHVWSNPDLGIVTYGAHVLDIDAVADGMEARGWFVGRLMEPRGIHIMLTLAHGPVADEYLKDLRAAVADVTAGKVKAVGGKVVY